MDNAEQAFQRSKIYRLFSYCFFYPEKELKSFLASGECVRDLEESLTAYPLSAAKYSAEMEALFADARKHSGDEDLITDEHMRLFTLKSAFSPCETDYYRSFLAVFSTEEMADVAGFYRAFGMDFSLERPDYIAAELEFMHLASLREAEALAGKESEKAALCRLIEKKFLDEHLGRWVSAFSEALTSTDSVFYRPLASLLDVWIDDECRLFGLSPQKVTPFYLSMDEEEPMHLCGIKESILREDI